MGVWTALAFVPGLWKNVHGQGAQRWGVVLLGSRARFACGPDFCLSRDTRANKSSFFSVWVLVFTSWTIWVFARPCNRRDVALWQGALLKQVGAETVQPVARFPNSKVVKAMGVDLASGIQ